MEAADILTITWLVILTVLVAFRQGPKGEKGERGYDGMSWDQEAVMRHIESVVKHDMKGYAFGAVDDPCFMEYVVDRLNKLQLKKSD